MMKTFSMCYDNTLGCIVKISKFLSTINVKNMIKAPGFYALIPIFTFSQENVIQANRFLSASIDACALGQGGVGVATYADAFSQYQNPAKYLFLNTNNTIGLTSIISAADTYDEFSQLNVSLGHKIDYRRAYSLGIRNYAYTVNQYLELERSKASYEMAVEASYCLKLDNEFGMAITSRFISLKGKSAITNANTGKLYENSYGIDITGYYFGVEKAFAKFNGRWRFGFVLCNLRGTSRNETNSIAIYAPTDFKVGIGFDVIFNQNHVLAITTEYRKLLSSNNINTSENNTIYELEDSTTALGLEYSYQRLFYSRLGYSLETRGPGKKFGALGLGFASKLLNIDIGFRTGEVPLENPIRSKTRLSLTINLDKVF